MSVVTEILIIWIMVLLQKKGEHCLLMKALVAIFVFSVFLGILLVSPSLSLLLSYGGHGNVAQLNDLRVLNRNTGNRYSTIQDAINAPETLDGHEVFVASGTYYEGVTVNKSLSLVGEDRSTTIIDGNGATKVIYVTANNVKVTDFTIKNGTFGLWLDNSQNSKIKGNTVQDCSYGIRLYHSRNTEVSDNNVYACTYFGVEFDSSGNSTLQNNNMAENKYNFGVDGKSLSDFINNIDTSNTVNGKPIQYLINRHNITIDSFTFRELGYLALVNSTNIKVQDLMVQDNIQGALFAFTANSTINNVNARNNWNGVYVAHSWNISASESNSNYNFDYGIKFFDSPRSSALDNNVDNNGWSGIGLFGSPNSTIGGNEANFNMYNLHIVYTNNSIITANNAGQRKPSGYSIAVYYSHNNLIYHNTFANSLLYVETKGKKPFVPRNNWDDGLEGNFWSSYGGADANQDGLGDSPLTVGENNTDNHPLMGKFSKFAVSLEGKSYCITVVSNSTVSQFQFSVGEGKIRFIATGSNGTGGFARVAIPNELLLHMESSNLTFWINQEQPVLKRKWMDGVNTYWYFSYVNSLSEPTINPWLIIAVALVILIVSASVFIVFKKKRESSSQCG
jgi:parallel beta-helix repeat protein